MSTYHADNPLPPGKARGCLPRRSKFGSVCPIFRERIDVLTDAEIKELTGKITLRHFCDVLDQDGGGSCASESSTEAEMVGRAYTGLPRVILNPWFVYNAVRYGRDGGSTIDDNLAFIREHGVAPESVWPRSKGWEATPSAEAKAAALDFRIEEFYDIETTRECVSALLLGHPVVYGADGHALCKIEHLNDREGLDCNSWGTSWGDGGFGVWVPYNRIGWGYGMFAVRTVKVPANDIVAPEPAQ